MPGLSGEFLRYDVGVAPPGQLNRISEGRYTSHRNFLPSLSRPPQAGSSNVQPEVRIPDCDTREKNQGLHLGETNTEKMVLRAALKFLPGSIEKSCLWS